MTRPDSACDSGSDGLTASRRTEEFAIQRPSKRARIGWVRDCDTLEIAEIVPGSAAAEAGLVTGMRIHKIDGICVHSDDECSERLRLADAAFTVEVLLPEPEGIEASVASQSLDVIVATAGYRSAVAMIQSGAAAAAAAAQPYAVAASSVAVAATTVATSAVTAAASQASAAADQMSVKGVLPALAAATGSRELQETATLLQLAVDLRMRHSTVSIWGLPQAYMHLCRLHGMRGEPAGRGCPPVALQSVLRHFRYAAAIMGPASCRFLGITPLPTRSDQPADVSRRRSILAALSAAPQTPESPGCEPPPSCPPTPPPSPRSPTGGLASAIARLCDIPRGDVFLYRDSGLAGGVFQPARAVCRDALSAEVVVSLRGTMSMGDLLTDLCCTAVTESFAGGEGQVHRGFLAAAEELCPELEEAVKSVLQPGDTVVLTGHSLGAAVGAVLCELWFARNTFPGHPIRCYAFGAPCCFDSQTSHDASPRILSVINKNDAVSRLSLGSVERLAAGLAVIQDVAAGGGDLATHPKTRTYAALHEAATTRLEECGAHEALTPPGTLIYVTSDNAPIVCENHAEFQDMRLEMSMFANHMPGRLFSTLGEIVL